MPKARSTSENKSAAKREDGDLLLDRTSGAGSPATRFDPDAHKKKLQLSRTYRKLLIANLYLTSAMSHADISAYLKDEYDIDISAKSVGNDILSLKEQWQAETLRSTTEALNAELNKLQMWEQAAILGHADGMTTKDFVACMLGISKRRARLLGLDKLEISVKDKRTSHMSDAELEDIINLWKKGQAKTA